MHETTVHVECMMPHLEIIAVINGMCELGNASTDLLGCLATCCFKSSQAKSLSS
jgi:hypothetical protein